MTEIIHAVFATNIARSKYRCTPIVFIHNYSERSSADFWCSRVPQTGVTWRKFRAKSSEKNVFSALSKTRAVFTSFTSKFSVNSAESFLFSSLVHNRTILVRSIVSKGAFTRIISRELDRQHDSYLPRRSR